jgi:diazepam-binding inhibitor (GABA receptor modulating acyl-CoA-binding protein)
MEGQKRFELACRFVEQSKGDVRFTQAVQLELYALFKVATVGPATADKAPSLWDVVGRAKYDAWQRLGTETSAPAAKLHYCSVLDGLFPGYTTPRRHREHTYTRLLFARDTMQKRATR